MLAIPKGLKEELWGVLELADKDEEEAKYRLEVSLIFFYNLGECGKSQKIDEAVMRSLMGCQSVGQLRWMIRNVLRSA